MKIDSVDMNRANPNLWTEKEPTYQISVHDAEKNRTLYITGYTAHSGYKYSLDFTYAKPYTYRSACGHLRRLMQDITIV